MWIESIYLTSGLLAVIIGFLAIIIVLYKSNRRRDEQLKILNHELSHEKKIARHVLDSSQESILITDKAGNILYANPKTGAIFDLDPLSAGTLHTFCKHIEPHLDHADSLYKPIGIFMTDDNKSLTLQFEFTSSNEDRLYIELIATEIQDETIEDGASYLFVFRDRTGEENVLQMKNELISVVSHELKTPLSSILGFVEILLYREVAADKQKLYLQTIYNEAMRLSHIIKDFLDLERMESGQQKYHITPVALDPLLLEIVEQWSEKQVHNIQLELQPNAVFVYADEIRLRQVINHLINNALKYSPEANKIHIRLELNQGKASIQIQDYGLGIPVEAKSKLFTKFYRVDNSDHREAGGTGLGLSVCKEIIELLNGQLSFTSVLGEGSTFTVELSEYEIVNLHQKIVMVRDNDTIAQLVINGLESLKMSFVHFDTVEACIFALNNCNAAEKPLMMFLDLNLQGLNSGWSVLDKLHEVSGFMEVPVIIFRPMEFFGKSNEFEIIAQMIKLIDSETIAGTINYMLNKEHQHTFLFSARDESIISTLEHRGMNIKNVIARPSYTEIELDSKQISNEI
jgi:signal transduction histidine kinase